MYKYPTYYSPETCIVLDHYMGNPEKRAYWYVQGKKAEIGLCEMSNRLYKSFSVHQETISMPRSYRLLLLKALEKVCWLHVAVHLTMKDNDNNYV